MISLRWWNSAGIIRRDDAAARALALQEYPPAVDRGFRLLTRSADRSVLWLGIAAGLVATRDRRARRAAVRGVGSIAVASLLANQPAKRAVPRRRPLLAYLPLARVAHRVPTSSSFPSGHSASAAAFAVGAALELPPLAVPLGALAAGVAFSRVYTGVHYPSDVVAGVALGATVAAVGRAVVPAHSREPRCIGSETAAPQPLRPTGRGLIVVANPLSGRGAAVRTGDVVRQELPDAEVLELDEDDDVMEKLRDAAKRAEVLGVAGGDGTVNTAATVAVETDLPLLVLPGGTFNHFARDLGLAEMADSIEALATGRAVRIDVGDASGALFVNTSSLGSYPHFVAVRERWERRVGKPIAAAIAIRQVLRKCPPLAVTMDGVPHELTMLFVGNNVYQPRNFAPRWRPLIDSGELDVRFVDARRPGTMPRLMLAALVGRLHRSPRYVQLRRTELVVRMTGEPGLLARDGEITDAPSEVIFTVRRRALVVYRGPD
ncbi:MAG: diacylglycerol kinase family protein [Actinomycetota bacterium]